MHHVSSEKNLEYAVLNIDTNDVRWDSCLINIPTFIFKNGNNECITNTAIVTTVHFYVALHHVQHR